MFYSLMGRREGSKMAIVRGKGGRKDSSKLVES